MQYAHPKSEWGQVKGEKRGKGRIIPEKYKHDSFVKLYVILSTPTNCLLKVPLKKNFCYICLKKKNQENEG